MQRNEMNNCIIKSFDDKSIFSKTFDVGDFQSLYYVALASIPNSTQLSEL